MPTRQRRCPATIKATVINSTAIHPPLFVPECCNPNLHSPFFKLPFCLRPSTTHSLQSPFGYGAKQTKLVGLGTNCQLNYRLKTFNFNGYDSSRTLAPLEVLDCRNFSSSLRIRIEFECKENIPLHSLLFYYS